MNSDNNTNKGKKKYIVRLLREPFPWDWEFSVEEVWPDPLRSIYFFGWRAEETLRQTDILQEAWERVEDPSQVSEIVLSEEILTYKNILDENGNCYEPTK